MIYGLPIPPQRARLPSPRSQHTLAPREHLEQPPLVEAGATRLHWQGLGDNDALGADGIVDAPLASGLEALDGGGAQYQPGRPAPAQHGQRGQVEGEARRDVLVGPRGDGDGRAPRSGREEERRPHGAVRGADGAASLPPAKHRGRAQAERVEGAVEWPRVAGVGVGEDAARHPKDEPVPLVAVVAEQLAGQAKGDARYLGEPLLGAVRRVGAPLPEPERVDVRVELGVGEVRVAGARDVQVKQEGRLALAQHGRQGAAQTPQHVDVVRRAVEVDAVDLEVAHEPEDALDPVIVPAGGEGGRLHRRVRLAVGEHAVPRGGVVCAQVLAEPRVAAGASRAHQHLAAQCPEGP
mmetsp:Transcript_49880/g.162375  ORF Transcript_49880/g.162375 Transcript_49880/m.162375 type:complete len:351 (+) Transcript_49880:3-1055(+)